MGRTRFRKRKYTWMPQLGFENGAPEDDTVVVPVTIAATSSDGLPGQVSIFPVVPDAPKEAAAANTDTLSDFIGGEWFLKRIVGKITFCTNPQVQALSTDEVGVDFLIGVGFFIARAGDDNVMPIGAATPSPLSRANYGPLNLSTTREPWIWHRTWSLSPKTTLAGGQDVSGTYPRNNYCGSVAEGTHIDAKTARRIGQDDRLYIATQAMVTQVNGGVNTTAVQMPDGMLAIRILGQLRKARQRSAF